MACSFILGSDSGACRTEGVDVPPGLCAKELRGQESNTLF
jgi:hypothetical protein